MSATTQLFFANYGCGELDGVFGGFAVFWPGGISDASLALSMTWRGMWLR
jgi:hypothetical protein